jgi:hypothetical protein
MHGFGGDAPCRGQLGPARMTPRGKKKSHHRSARGFQEARMTAQPLRVSRPPPPPCNITLRPRSHVHQPPDRPTKMAHLPAHSLTPLPSPHPSRQMYSLLEPGPLSTWLTGAAQPPVVLAPTRRPLACLLVSGGEEGGLSNSTSQPQGQPPRERHPAPDGCNKLVSLTNLQVPSCQ